MPPHLARSRPIVTAPMVFALLEALTQPGLQVEEVFKRVRKEVVSVTGNRQIQGESSSLTGDFVFNETDTLAHVCADAPRSSEGVFWTSIRNSNDAADFEAYLEHFPDGLYSSLAKSKL